MADSIDYANMSDEDWNAIFGPVYGGYDYSNEGLNYPTTDSTQGSGGSPINASTTPTSWESLFKNVGNLFTGKSSLGTAGSIAGMAGLAALLNKAFGTSSGQYSGYQGGIPSYTASRTMLPIPATVPAPTAENPEAVAPRRPGSGGVTYFTPMQYTKNAAAGGIMSLPRYNLGGYSDGGRLLRGPGDGVSDDIPATIGDCQPARLADGEFVIPARIVSELGNGSTESGARKLYAMMDRVKKSRMKSSKNIAADTKADKHLPA